MEFMLPPGAVESSEETWLLLQGACRVHVPAKSKAAGSWAFGSGANPASGLVVLVLRKPRPSGSIPIN